MSAAEVGRKAMAYLTQYKQASMRRSQYSNSDDNRWQPPETGTVKISCDGACKEGEKAGFGTVIRDSEGVVWGAVAGPLAHCYSVEEVEAVAIREGMLLARDLRFTKVIVENDNSGVVAEIHRRGPSFALFGDIVQETKALAQSFELCNFRHINRSCNRMADYLASLGLSADSTTTWVHEIPMALADAAMSTILKTFFRPYLNTHLGRGFPLPLPHGFTLQNAEIVQLDSRVTVCNNLRYGNRYDLEQLQIYR